LVTNFGGENAKLPYPTFVYHASIPQRVGRSQHRWVYWQQRLKVTQLL